MNEVSINVNLDKRARIFLKSSWIKEMNIKKKILIAYDSRIADNIIYLKAVNSKRKIEITIMETFYVKLEILKEIDITKDNIILTFPILYLKLFKKLGFKSTFKARYELTEKGELKLTLPNKKRKNIVLFKVNKGGVGKTFLTTQIAYGLTQAEPTKKVLIITSDSQNNVLNFLDTEEERKIENGLIKDVLYRKGEYIELRRNLFFLPLESAKFGRVFLSKLNEWFEEKRLEYDYILIDSIPTMKIDEEFVNISDHIVIPAYYDEVTVVGILNLIKEIDIKKIIAIQGNKYKKRNVEKKYKEKLEAIISETKIMMNDPIPDISFIESILDNKKSVFEYSSTKIRDTQKIIMKLILKIVEVVNNG